MKFSADKNLAANLAISKIWTNSATEN